MLTTTLPTKADLKINKTWNNLRFRKAKTDGYALIGIPAAYAEKVAARLFVLGAKCIEVVQYIEKRQAFFAINFTCPMSLAVEFATRFPAPEGTEPLALSNDKSRILSGAAAAKATQFQPTA